MSADLSLYSFRFVSLERIRKGGLINGDVFEGELYRELGEGIGFYPILTAINDEVRVMLMGNPAGIPLPHQDGC